MANDTRLRQDYVAGTLLYDLPSAGTVVTDGVTTDTDTEITSATANFTAADVGAPVSGAGIPAGAWIATVNSASSVEISSAATATATGVTITISRHKVMHSAGLGVLVEVDADHHAMLSLNSDGSGAIAPETVMVTRHDVTLTWAQIERAQEGTVAATFAASTEWMHTPLASDFESPVKDVIYTPLNGANALDDEFDTSYSGWTEVHQNATVLVPTVAAGVLSIKHPGTPADASSQASHAYLKSIPSLSYPFTIQAGFRMMRRYATNYHMAGLIFTDGVLSSSNCVWMMPYASTATAAAWTLSTRMGTLASVGTDSGSQTWEIAGGGVLHQRLTAVSANLWRAEYSPDGVSWVQWPTADFARTLTPTHMGFATATWGTASGQQILTVEYFRVNP